MTVIGHESYAQALETVPLQTTNHMWQASDDYKQMLLNSRWGNAFRAMHNISQDNLPDLKDFTTDLVPLKVPNIIGRDLCSITNVNVPVTQFPVFEKEGEAGDSAFGDMNIDSRSGSIGYNELKLSKEINVHDSVNQNFIEDVQPAMVSEYWQELYRVHRLKVSRYIIAQITGIQADADGEGLTAWTDESGNSFTTGATYGRFGQGGTAGTFHFKDILWALTKAKKQNWMPDCMLTTWDFIETMLGIDEFKSSDYFQQIPDWNGLMFTRLFGLDVFVSNQILKADGDVGTTTTNQKFWIFEKEQFLKVGFRRDEMITNTEDKKTMHNGLSISSRLGSAFRDPQRCILMSDQAQ